MTTPSFTARADQATAAHDHLISLLDEDVAAGTTTTFLPVRSSAYLALQMRLPLRMAAGETDFCEHAKACPESTMFWFARKPARIRCADCIQRLAAREAAQKKMPRCDGCGKPRRGLRSTLSTVPARAYPAAELVHGPVLCEYLLCPKCVPVAAAA